MNHFQIRNPTLRPKGALHLSEGQRPSYVIDNPTNPRKGETLHLKRHCKLFLKAIQLENNLPYNKRTVKKISIVYVMLSFVEPLTSVLFLNFSSHISLNILI